MESYYCLLRAAAMLEAAAAEIVTPICAKDISDDLMKEFAFLSGGRGKDNSWIITLPDSARFNEIPEEIVSKVLTYLTSVPSLHESDTKFILILDRRLDTWTSVKTTLQKIAASFPGNLHLVMVLRPTGFFQRTFTDIGFRFSQEDFLLKLPVVMLSSVSDLLTYIDEHQLTPEFGGTLEYCHSEWVIFRTAIESFALTVKEIAQMLQSFGMELAETELPDDIYSIERILALRTEKYYQLKEDITAVTKEGNLLLSSFEEPNLEECSQDQNHERPGDWETVNRLLGQLREMETAFDGFWEKHQLKMEQYLQLWKFEQSFQEVKNAIEFLMGQQAELPDTGDSVPQVKQRLKDLGHFDGMAQDLIGKAQVVILHGHQLAANHHYALNLICQQCNELRHHSDVLSDEIKRKQTRLQKTLDLHTHLQQALQCCDEGAYLLANQQMDKCQSKEGAQKALQDIERFLESSSAYLNYDPQALHCDFESVLTSELKCQIQSVQVKLENVRSMFENRQSCFKRLLDKHVRPVQLVAPRPENPPRSKSPLFSPKHGVDFNSSLKFSFDLSLPGKKTSRKTPSSRKIEVMHDYQEKRNSLQTFISDSDDNLDILKGHVINELIETERVYVEELFTVLTREDFQMYEKYCQNKPRSESLWRQCSESSFFQECQRKLEHKLGLDSYLLKPVQRLTKYQLLLKELLKYSTSCDGVQELQEALVAMLDLLKSVNDSMHQISITGYDGDLSELGKVLMQGSFSVWTGHRKGPTKMKDLARFKPMQRHLFLYEKALVFCKKREDHGDGYDKTSSYSFKHFLKMNAVGITENVKGDHRKFEIWYSGREEVYVVQAQTVDLKMAWLNEIRKILFKQQELIKVEKQQPSLCTDQAPLSSQLSDGKQQRASISSEENDSERTSPVMLDSGPLSPQNKPHRSWTGMSQSLEICEGLEEWSGHQYLSNCSDTEEEDGNQLSPGKYKALADCKRRGSEDLLVKNGDEIQLLHEDGEGQWLVKNLNRRKEGWVPVHSLQIVVGDCRFRNAKVADAALCNTRKFSSP
ncbi:proto-oncogene DBL isoform X2 [Calypte anna]|uniref:proto-oncogene DBL isoform X2 n=1 Tax=Calypte anna TaxID=9244 RepID=UPI0011C349D1|nr:proto-oncogene DBL isoform X2 [Calypte anna]